MADLKFEPALQHLDLVPESVGKFLRELPEASAIEVAEIDPAYTGSGEFTEHYGVPPELGANCVIVEAVRGDVRTLAACVVPIGTRADLNKTARKILDARRVSFAPLDEVLEKTGMEYGSITLVGLPEGWPILIDKRITEAEKIIIGGGLVKSKLRLPGKILAALPGAIVIEGLGV